MKNNYVMYSAVGIIITLGLVFALFTSSNNNYFTGNMINDVPDKSDNILSTLRFERIYTGTTEDGDVMIDLKPLRFENGQLVVDFGANTHSVDQSQFNLKEMTTLEYNGKLYKPVSAPVMSGHHTFGELVFNIGKEINTFTIKINGIPYVQERIFGW